MNESIKTRKKSSGGKLPLKALFPKATPEQLQALTSGQPCPPSPDWTPTATAVGPIQPAAPMRPAGPSITPSPVIPVLPSASEPGEPLPSEPPGRAVSGDEPRPLVSCITVLSQAARVGLARHAARHFMLQRYLHKQLVIVNASGTPVLQPSEAHPNLKEVAVNLDSLDADPIATLRTRGLGLADGIWVRMWDDDDIYHPDLLRIQMAYRRAGYAVCLTHQIRVRYPEAAAFLYHDPNGIPSTAVFQNRPGLVYPPCPGYGEDAAFLAAHFKGRVVAIPNPNPPDTLLTVAVHHGKNATPAEVFMAGRHTPEHANRWDLRPAEIAYLRQAMEPYGAKAQSGTPPTQVPTAV